MRVLTRMSGVSVKHTCYSNLAEGLHFLNLLCPNLSEFSEIHMTCLGLTFLVISVYEDGSMHSCHAIHRRDASQLLFLEDGVTGQPPTCIARVS